MEKESTESSALAESQTMDESLEFIFSAMISQGEIIDALDFVRSIEVNFMPSKTVMRTIIFEVLMKSDDIRCLAFSSDYLVTILNVFPPVNDECRQFYYDSITDSHGYLADLWTVFSHIVNSYFCYRGIYVIDTKTSSFDPIKYPNCKFLLEFYVKLFAIDFENRYSDSFTPCLVMKLFWPKLDSRGICLSCRTEALFKWINDIYGCSFANDMGDLLGCMHDLLTLIVRCIIQGRHNLSNFAAFSHPALAEIVENMINFCHNAFTNLSNVKLFLNSLSIKYLQAKVSEKIIRQIIKQSSKRSYVLTLKDIVDQCMFPPKYNKWKHTKCNINKEKNLRKRSVDKKATVSDKKLETTNLHEFCKENKFGDLSQALKLSRENINARDHTGSTPLHEACQRGHGWCVKVLIDEVNKDVTQTLDFAAANVEGLTPLHLAAMKDSVDIAVKLLFHGGSDLLMITDNNGQRPIDLSTSEAMNKVLQEYQYESDSSVDSRVREAPILKSFKEYSIYLHALNCLLCTYCVVFNLYDFIWQKNTVVQSHNDKICCHFIDQDVCSEDAALILEMPDLIDTFIESVCKNVSKSEHNINVDIELIPLRAFAASLKVL